MSDLRQSNALAQLKVTELNGVGPKVAEKLAKLGLVVIQDLLFHLPYRYEDRTRIYPIAALMPGIHGSVCGEIISSDVTFGRKRMLRVRINDGGGALTLRFFTFSAAQKNSFVNGKWVRCFGEIKRGQHGFEIIHPEYSVGEQTTLHTMEQALTPVYPTTEGLKQISLRKLSDQALAMLSRHGLPELIPADLMAHPITLNDALQQLHRPPPDISLEQLELGQHPAQQRLALEELTAHQVSVRQLRQKSDLHKAQAIVVDGRLQQQLLAQLPFSPTNAQQRVVREITADLAKAHPMMRLVQGDVGSGKTLVAAMTAALALQQGGQVALMAPTELLAEQHALTLAAWFEPLGIKLAWLAGKLKGKARQASLDAIANGEAQLVVGTHAIFQEQVIFHDLILVIIDEQHRFGVHQRLALREKGNKSSGYPHQLIMTATPIPRTLAMTAYADLDTSIIDELPPGRTPVTTVAIPDNRREEVISRVSMACSEGKQAYWVCTLIDESEVLQCQAAEESSTALQELLPHLNIGLVHGRMKADEKQQVMAQFKSGQLQLLVATTVIEVGVDVPNASLMIIENPERLGLAQLHQLRGRVGRGSVSSHCVLLYHAPLSKTATKRLGVLRQTNDGFQIAQHDLEIRGPGELLGTRQTGLAQLKIADLLRDQGLIPMAQRIAEQLHSRYPAYLSPLTQRWLQQELDYGAV
ncbi:ATP-dependent DNA helicase RecG [Corallincola holothuriorum]|uniref:ATP-dependent DNA helicase RecG n=1 Tax=Corallincola holothuriorum TaxID=2282215 RepID=A0A368NKN3_9GAMM|nr:ATP-dependent DNA helicase RecG [Corallincola holothuriorum]RCU51008.1 ATP-dependent DNA helicase RecG [Corallincola holothuriorum]